MFEEAARNKRRKMSMNDKRRFSDDQIRCLELMFESDTKLEPRKKVEVAKSLGLQPRQVAIWFQNKRARWKSKHLEKEYASLLSSYNDLAARFESLKKEKQALLLQLEKLKKENEKESEGESESNNNSNNANGKNGLFEVKKDEVYVYGEEEGRMEWLQQQQQQRQVSEEEEELMRMVDTSDWGSLDSDDIIISDQITSDDQWWGFSSFVD